MANFQIGSYQHKKLFCELLKNHPVSAFSLPTLEAETKQRLGELKIWPWVFGQHQQFGGVAQSFSQVVKGALLKDAIAQMADNELALAQTVKTLCKKNRFDSVGVGDSAPMPPNESVFRQCNHQENLSLFLASGLYGLALQEGYLQSDLLKVWDEMLDAQAQHVLFFVNWLAFESEVKQKPDYELSGLGSLWTLRSQAFGILNKLNRSDYDDNLPRDPLAIDCFLGKYVYSEFLNTCEQNYQARFESFDERLIRPKRLLQASTFFRTLLGFWPQRVNATRPSSV